MSTQPLSLKKDAASSTKVYVRTVSGTMVHLFTNVVLTTDPKKVEIDGFLQAQIDAGKLLVVPA